MPAIERYIQEKLKGVVAAAEDIPDKTFMEDDPALLLVSQEPMEQMEVDEFEDEEDGREEEEEVKNDFIKALKEYGEKVVGISGDKAMVKAMRAMTRTLKNSQKSTPHTLQQQMHGFGARGAASRRTKTGMLIRPNPPAISKRMAPGSMPAPLGRRPKDRSGEVGTIGGLGLGGLANRTKRPHNLSLAVENNVPNSK